MESDSTSERDDTCTIEESSVYARPCPPYGTRAVRSVLGRSTLFILKSGAWQKSTHTVFKRKHYEPMDAELQWCEWIDAVRMRLQQLSTGRSKKRFFRLSPDRKDDLTHIDTIGMTLKGVPSPRDFARTSTTTLSKDRLPLLHLFVSMVAEVTSIRTRTTVIGS